MRVLLVLLVLFLWAGFALGSVALVGYLGVKAVAAIRRPDVGSSVVLRSHPWRRSEQALAAAAAAGALCATVQWLSFSSHDANFLFAAGPALAFAVLAALATVVARRDPSVPADPSREAILRAGPRASP